MMRPLAILFSAFAVLFVPNVVEGQTFDPAGFTERQFLEFEKQLNAILKTRRNEEKDFIKAVVKKVREKELPSKLVSTSYQWVRNKRPNTNYPFIYFERVLRLQAAKVKLEDKVPSFDFSIYKKRASSSTRTASRGSSTFGNR